MTVLEAGHLRPNSAVPVRGAAIRNLEETKNPPPAQSAGEGLMQCQGLIPDGLPTRKIKIRKR